MLAVYMKRIKCDIALFYESFPLTQLKTSYLCIKITNQDFFFIYVTS